MIQQEEASRARPVFVLGTGRSGTHWLGESLGGHPEVRATIEIEPMFGMSTRIALDRRLERKAFPRLVQAYKRQIERSPTPIYLDKAHPNIWTAEKLKRAFPDALFLGTERNPYATVASMMKHGGVADWHRQWRKYPIPNRFLGITKEAAATYADLSLASKCAMRWVAHHRRMEVLKTRLGDALRVISYEALAHDPARMAAELERFLGLTVAMPVPDVQVESLHKWRHQLTPEQIADIREVVGVDPVDD